MVLLLRSLTLIGLLGEVVADEVFLRGSVCVFFLFFAVIQKPLRGTLSCLSFPALWFGEVAEWVGFCCVGGEILRVSNTFLQF